jgi:GT2 family glycosyltransferase
MQTEELIGSKLNPYPGIDVSFIVVTYNSAGYIPAFLASIQKYMLGVSYEIIIVDNCSVDDTVPLIREQRPDAHIIENKTNAGFGAANNQGAEVARGDFLFLLNADTEMLDNGISEAIRYARTNGTAIIGPKTLGIDKILLTTWKECSSLNYHMWDLVTGALRLKRFFRPKSTGELQVEQEVEFLTGSAMLISRAAYEKLGLFDEQFFFTGEERDLCMRYTRAGLKLVYFPGWSILHYVSYGNPNSPFHYINWVKSSLKLARKHGGFLGYMMMSATLGLYSFSLAVFSTLKQLRDISHAENSNAAKISRRFLYWFLGMVSEKKVLSLK